MEMHVTFECFSCQAKSTVCLPLTDNPMSVWEAQVSNFAFAGWTTITAKHGTNNVRYCPDCKQHA